MSNTRSIQESAAEGKERGRFLRILRDALHLLWLSLPNSTHLAVADYVLMKQHKIVIGILLVSTASVSGDERTAFSLEHGRRLRQFISRSCCDVTCDGRLVAVGMKSRESFALAPGGYTATGIFVEANGDEIWLCDTLPSRLVPIAGSANFSGLTHLMHSTDPFGAEVASLSADKSPDELAAVSAQMGYR